MAFFSFSTNFWLVLCNVTHSFSVIWRLFKQFTKSSLWKRKETELSLLTTAVDVLTLQEQGNVLKTEQSSEVKNAHTDTQYSFYATPAKR